MNFPAIEWVGMDASRLVEVGLKVDVLILVYQACLHLLLPLSGFA
jgi:hypothetical protein